MTWVAEELLLGFARALRAAGLPVSSDRAMTFVAAAAEVGIGDRAGLYWAARATLTASPADLEAFDQVFDRWFAVSETPRTTRKQQTVQRVPQAAWDSSDDQAKGASDSEAIVPAVASEREVLRQRDIAELSTVERIVLRQQFATLRPRSPMRRGRRHTHARRGPIDGRATLRSQLRRLGEPGVVAHRRRTTRPRRVVLLIDVSGSMSAYADALLRLAHTVVRSAPASTEVFTMGTRLTHVTRALRQRDPDRALVAAGSAVPDWSGGTRLGEALAAFVDRWGRRGMARGAVVVVFSDGWERGNPRLLGEQMRRLSAVAHRVVWVNPHRGRPKYAPVQSGIVAALPHVDHFVAGHSLAAFGEVLEVVGDA